MDPKTGGYLWEYRDRNEAVRSRKPDTLIRREVEPYECFKCGYWHRRPVEDGPVPNDVLCMRCMGRDGMPKQSYPSAYDALVAASLLSGGGTDLSAYECPHGRGFHLTKN